jgi:hypothetical protein
VWSAADFDVMYYSVAIVSIIGRSMYLCLQDKIYRTINRPSKFRALHSVLYLCIYLRSSMVRTFLRVVQIHVARVTVPACAMVLPSEVRKTRVWF